MTNLIEDNFNHLKEEIEYLKTFVNSKDNIDSFTCNLSGIDESWIKGIEDSIAEIDSCLDKVTRLTSTPQIVITNKNEITNETRIAS